MPDTHKIRGILILVEVLNRWTRLEYAGFYTSTSQYCSNYQPGAVVLVPVLVLVLPLPVPGSTRGP
jgi:hypothetical protein